ncbi:MAG: ABC transporter transmembrane domain-containing protein [Hyphomicrobiales bacterium]|nr:ABC transporter transmembrane domain-containing protein [Hyphomicrobiales bacterium]
MLPIPHSIAAPPAPSLLAPGVLGNDEPLTITTDRNLKIPAPSAIVIGNTVAAAARRPEPDAIESPKKKPQGLYAVILDDFLTLPPTAILASLFINILALGLPFTILQIYDRVLPNQAVGTLSMLIIALMGVITIDALLKRARNALIGHAAKHESYRLRMDAATRLLFSNTDEIPKQPGWYWLDRMTAVEEMAAKSSSNDRTVLLDLPFIVIFLGITGIIGGWLVAVPIVLIITFFVIIVVLGARQKVMLHQRREDDDERYGYIAEWLSGIRTIKLLALEPQILRRFERLMGRATVNTLQSIIQNSRILTLGQLFSSVMMIAVLSAGTLLVIEGAMSVGALACCSLLATRVAQPVFRLMGMWTQVQASSLTLSRAADIQALPLPTMLPASVKCSGAICAHDVTIKRNSKTTDLSGISLSIDAGEIIGITAPSGKGKSDLLAAISGQITPTSGTVEIDGVDIRTPSGRALLRSVFMIQGKPVIFNGTILENITMYRRGAAVGAAVEAAQSIGLDEMINLLPEGYETKIGAGSSLALPSGVHHSIVIARALAANAKILLVDELSAALDETTHRRIRNALLALKGRVTIVLASTRQPYLKLADRVFEIKDGQLQPHSGFSADLSQSTNGVSQVLRASASFSPTV